MEWFETLNDIGFCYLTHLGERPPQSLSFQIEEAPASDFDDDVDGFLGGLSLPRGEIGESIEPRVFQVRFDSFIAYAVRNESYAVNDPYETFDGRVARIYRRSRFLDFVSNATLASDAHPGPFCHYGFLCLEHVLDVVGTAPPTIKAGQTQSL